MESYKNIIVAIELDSKSDRDILKQAQEFIHRGVNVTLVHAIEHLTAYSAAYGVALGTELEEILLKRANEEIKKTGEKLKIAKENCIVKFGSAKILILEEAEKLKADLIIIGSHGRSGLKLLLGSTANAVLHGAKCDVLAVRLKQ